MKIDKKRILPYLLVPSDLRVAQFEKVTRLAALMQESLAGVSDNGEIRIATGSYIEMLEVIAALQMDIEACFKEPIAKYGKPIKEACF